MSDAGRRQRPAAGPLRLLARTLTSRLAAVSVMAVLAGILALASLAPVQELDDPEAAAELEATRPLVAWLVRELRPEELVTSKLFLLLPGWLFFSISLSVVQRIQLHRRASALGFRRERERFRVERTAVVPAPPGEAAGRIERALRRAGYEVTPLAEGAVVGRRGRLGFYGSLAFHVGLLIVLVGVVASAATRVSGELLLTEGFPAPFVRASFLRVWGEERLPDHPEHQLLIGDFVAEYSRAGTPVQFSMLLTVLRDGVREEEAVLRVNEPFSWRRFQFMLHRYGFAPDVSFVDPTGVLVADGVAALQLIPPGSEDVLALEDGGSIALKLYPDFVETKAGPASASLAPRKPVLFFDWRDAAGATVASGRVRQGEQVEAGGRTIRFSTLSYWGDFLVTRDEGVLFLFLGSLVGCLGLVLRFVQPDQTFRATLSACAGGTEVRLLAGTRFFPAFHEEFVERFAASLEEGPLPTRGASS